MTDDITAFQPLDVAALALAALTWSSAAAPLGFSPSGGRAGRGSWG